MGSWGLPWTTFRQYFPRARARFIDSNWQRLATVSQGWRDGRHCVSGSFSLPAVRPAKTSSVYCGHLGHGGMLAQRADLRFLALDPLTDHRARQRVVHEECRPRCGWARISGNVPGEQQAAKEIGLRDWARSPTSLATAGSGSNRSASIRGRESATHQPRAKSIPRAEKRPWRRS